MIIDQLNNASKYFNLSKKFAKAFQYLQSTNYNDLQLGKHEIEGDDIYALVQQYWTGEKKDQLEAHRRYADIQYIVHGAELIGTANIKDLQAGEYNSVSDYVPMQGNATFFEIHEGTFAIFYPQDAHMPGIIFEKSQLVSKVVVKVLLE